MYVLNTDILVGFLRGSLPSALDLLNNIDCSLVKIPAIVKAELLASALRSDDVDKSRDAVQRLLYSYDILPFEGACVQEYARMRSRQDKAKAPVSPIDLMVASSAYVHGAKLVTNDVDRFAGITGLSILSLREVDF